MHFPADLASVTFVTFLAVHCLDRDLSLAFSTLLLVPGRKFVVRFVVGFQVAFRL
jgi:hypothetical protein